MGIAKTQRSATQATPRSPAAWPSRSEASTLPSRGIATLTHAHRTFSTMSGPTFAVLRTPKDYTPMESNGYNSVLYELFTSTKEKTFFFMEVCLHSGCHTKQRSSLLLHG